MFKAGDQVLINTTSNEDFWPYIENIIGTVSDGSVPPTMVEVKLYWEGRHRRFTFLPEDLTRISIETDPEYFI